MERIVIASTRRNAGKTGLTVGLAKATGRRIGFLKPFGDRLLYRKKRLWDYDGALVVRLLDLGHQEEELTLGFERVKLRYMYDQAATEAKLRATADRVSEGRDLLIVEGGADLSAGVSVFLDPVHLARTLDAALVVVVAGTEDSMVDDIAYLKRYVDLSGVRFRGVVLNKVPDPEDFRDTHLREVTSLGVDVLGILPYREELTWVSVRFLADALFARTIAGEGGLDGVAKNIFVGAMSTDAALRDAHFQKPRKLIITSGDRSDMVLAALESDTAVIVLANNILPPPNILSMASQRNIPVLLMPTDTFKTAKQIDDMEVLLTQEETAKVDLLTELVRTHVDLARVV
jgi:BioD-like phosphotransacetylase family protein